MPRRLDHCVAGTSVVDYVAGRERASPLPSTVAHLDSLVATGAEGWLVVSVVTADRRWRSRSFRATDVDGAAAFAAKADAHGLNVYVRSTLIGRPLSHTGERGGRADTSAVPALVVDLDVAGPGHTTRAEGLPLPPDLDAAMSIVSVLPAPSLTVDTGGGAHLWWLLDEPATENLPGLLGCWADGLTGLGGRAGFHVDPPDLARVLRVAGTHRRKPDVPANRVVLVDVAGYPATGLDVRPWCPTGRYGATDLLEALPRPSRPMPAPRPAGRRPTGDVGPADAVGAVVAREGWAVLLAPLGWTYEGTATMGGATVELWRRPAATSDYSLKCVPGGPAVAWSDQCGLPTGVGLSPWAVYVALHCAGDETGAARTLRRRSREVAA